MSGLSGLSNHWRERSFLIWAAVGFLPLAIVAFPPVGQQRVRLAPSRNRPTKVLGRRKGRPDVAIARPDRASRMNRAPPGKPEAPALQLAFGAETWRDAEPTWSVGRHTRRASGSRSRAQADLPQSSDPRAIEGAVRRACRWPIAGISGAPAVLRWRETDCGVPKSDPLLCNREERTPSTMAISSNSRRHALSVHPAIRPPSTRTSEPVVKEEASDSSHTTVLATSCGWPRRPMGTWATSLARALAGSGRP